MLSVFAAVTFTACKKQEDTVSKLVTVSYPTVIITSPQFYSFPVNGGPMPNANTIIATAYDSFYHENLKPVVDASKLSSLVPGLFIATVSAKNSYGFIGYAYVYVAITDIADTVDISGKYERVANGVTVNITKLGTGLYRSDNIAGVAAATPQYITPGYFVMEADGTTLDIPTQPTKSLGMFSGQGTYDEVTSLTDTTITLSIADNPNFGTQQRVFTKTH
ncbi:MAG: hypothetical protein JWQ38_3063 [Flavipsychrobacter sp.]|nr:hypothetical protein [Flavipsychrobacter sp.]